MQAINGELTEGMRMVRANVYVHEVSIWSDVVQILKVAVLLLLGIVLSVLLLSGPDAQSDFSDSGVGCIDDCLALEGDEQGTPCTFQTCQD